MSAGDKLRIGVLGSGPGGNLDAIFRAIHDRMMPVTVKVVLSDVRDAGILRAGRSHHAHTKFVYPGETAGVLDPASEQNLVNALQHDHVELVVLTGFNRPIGPALLAAFPNRIINIHPSMLPEQGLQAAQQALASGAATAHCTVYYVGPDGGFGETIAQAEADILPDDTPESLRDRIAEAEHILYPEVIDFFARQGTSECLDS